MRGVWVIGDGRLAALSLVLLAAGCGREKETEVIIRFPERGTCVVFGETIRAGTLGGRLARAQDKSALFDTMNFTIVMAPGMSDEDYEAIAKEAQGAIKSLGAGNRITVERQSRLIVRILSSAWFWVIAVVIGVLAYLKTRRV